jgi:hypothetical protein
VGLLYAGWCHRVPWSPLLGADPAVPSLHAARVRVLHRIHAQPLDSDLDGVRLATELAAEAGLEPTPRTRALVAAAFLEPLRAMAAADLEPPPPAPPGHVRFHAGMRTVVGSALIAAGEEVPIDPDEA